MTERLYDQNAFLRSFFARVVSCREENGLWAVELSRTAFFPEGGGQPGDTGRLGAARVTDTRERNGGVVHLCDRPLPEGAQVQGILDWEIRFARMQIHTGEHIVSGTAHALWRCENVGFHMNERLATLDFDRELSPEQLAELERKANETVWDDRPVRTSVPDPETLASLTFRQKKSLAGPVRLVEIPGVDLCACCAPHVERTGQIGLIRLIDAMRHRGGIRITMTAGRSAWEDAAARGRDAAALSRLFSAPRDALFPAAERLLAERDAARQTLADAERAYTSLLLRSADASGEDLVFFLPGFFSAAALRELAEAGGEKCGGVCAVFAGTDGDLRYAIASRHRDLRALAREINAAIGGRGGGAPGLIQGSASAGKDTIREVFHGQIIG